MKVEERNTGQHLAASVDSRNGDASAASMKYRHVIRANVRAGVAKLPTLMEGPVVPLKRRDDKRDGA